jgi:hypothetical protein
MRESEAKYIDRLVEGRRGRFLARGWGVILVVVVCVFWVCTIASYIGLYVSVNIVQL